MTTPLQSPPGGAKAALPASPSAFGALLEAVPDATVGVAADGRIAVANSDAERLFGYRPGELIGERLEMLVPERSREIHAAHRDGFFADPQTRPMGAGPDLSGRRRDGSEFPAEISLSSVETAAGRLAIAAVRDVGARRLAERAGERAAQELRETQGMAGIGSWTFDSATRTVIWSDELYRMIGWDPGGGPATGEAYLALVHPDDRGRLAAAYAGLLGGGEGFELDYRLMRPDGTERALHTLGREDPQHPGCYTGTVQDVTTLRAAERELRRQRKLLRERERQLSEAHALARLGTWEWDLAEPRARWSAETCRIFGQPKGFAPTYDQFIALIHPDDRARVDLRVTTVGPESESESDCRIQLPGGQIRHVQIRRFGRRDEHGQARSLFGTVQDITELKRAEQQLRERERQLQDAQALAHFGSWELDLTTGEPTWSDELCRIFGQPLGFAPTLDELIELVHPDDRQSLRREVERATESSFSDSEYRIVRPDGTIRHVHTRRFGRFGPDGRVTQLWGTTQDVTERTERERALRQAREHSEAIVAAMREGYCLTIDGTITAVNDALCELTGFPREELLGTRAPLPFWPPEQIEQMRVLRKEVLDEEGGTFELTLMRKDDTRFDAEITAQAAHNPDGSLIGFVNTIRDISERKRHETDLELLARTDPLTNLANHRTFHDLLGPEVARADRYKRPLSVAILDLDRFKQINDHFGHPVGDGVLQEVAKRLTACCRAGELIARVGGEEFAWLLPDADAEGALIAVERGRHAISSSPIAPVGTVTISAGVCDLARAGGVTELYDRADQALYQAKRGGRDRTVSFAG